MKPVVSREKIPKIFWANCFLFKIEKNQPKGPINHPPFLRVSKGGSPRENALRAESAHWRQPLN